MVTSMQVESAMSTTMAPTSAAASASFTPIDWSKEVSEIRGGGGGVRLPSLYRLLHACLAGDSPLVGPPYASSSSSAGTPSFGPSVSPRPSVGVAFNNAGVSGAVAGAASPALTSSAGDVLLATANSASLSVPSAPSGAVASAAAAAASGAGPA